MVVVHEVIVHNVFVNQVVLHNLVFETLQKGCWQTQIEFNVYIMNYYVTDCMYKNDKSGTSRIS